MRWLIRSDQALHKRCSLISFNEFLSRRCSEPRLILHVPAVWCSKYSKPSIYQFAIKLYDQRLSTELCAQHTPHHKPHHTTPPKATPNKQPQLQSSLKDATAKRSLAAVALSNRLRVADGMPAAAAAAADDLQVASDRGADLDVAMAAAQATGCALSPSLLTMDSNAAWEKGARIETP